MLKYIKSNIKILSEWLLSDRLQGATGMTSIPQMVIDAGYGLEDESEKLLNAVQNYKGSKVEIPGILLRHAEQTGENLYRMGKTFAGSEIDKWNGMSIEERCEAGGYIMGTLALLFAGGEESLSGKAAGEAGEVAGDASKTAETLEKTEKTAEALEKTIAPEVKAPYGPDEEELAMQRIFDEQRQPCEEYEDYLSEIRKHIDEPAPKVTIKGGTTSKPNQVHHYATNKSKTYTPQLEEITNKYGLDLDDAWNKDLLPHQGRHPNAYHNYVLDSMKQFDDIAQGDKDVFLKLYDNLKNNVKANPDMLYKDYWK